MTPDFQDGGRNVISHRKVLPSGEYSQIYPAHMQQRPAVPDP